MLSAGDKAPQIELAALAGEPFSLERHLERGPVALVFFKVSCPTCQFTLPFLERSYGAASAGGPKLFGVSQDNAERTSAFCRSFRLSFPMLLDSGREGYPASCLYGITNVPSLFLIERNGNIVSAVSGFHKEQLEQLGKEFGRSPFEAGERVPAMRPG